MFNSEKLLGSLLSTGTRRKRGLGGMMTGGIGLGLIGVAMEAAKHFMDKSENSQSGTTDYHPSDKSADSLPTSFVPGSPPPPPGKVSSSPPPPPGIAPATEPPAIDGENQDAVLLIRAMIAAANADGTIDEKEKSQIMNKLKGADLSEEEHAFITHELLFPGDLDSVVSQVKSSAIAKQVYAVSLMAIEVDTDQERDYLQNLAQGLKLDTDIILQINKELGL